MGKIRGNSVEQRPSRWPKPASVERAHARKLAVNVPDSARFFKNGISGPSAGNRLEATRHGPISRSPSSPWQRRFHKSARLPRHFPAEPRLNTTMFQTELLLREFVTHDVQRYILAKPEGFSFTPGQAIELAIDEPKWRDETRPFTLTNRVDDRVLELMIKSYGDHDGMTQTLGKSQPGQKLLLSEPFDSFTYE